MAYDPKDPADVAIMEGLVAEATARLQTKNTELIGELRKAREGKVDPALVERLEKQLDDVQNQLADAQKATKTLQKDNEKLTQRAEAGDKRVSSLLATTAMASAMSENKIADQFRAGVEAMFAPKATLKVENGVESVMIGDKTLGDAIKEFAASDAGKHYVAAANNGGGGSGGGGPDKGAKTMTRAAFDAMDPSQKMEFSKTGGTLTDT